MATNLYVNYLGQTDITLNGAIVAGDTSVNVTIPTVLATFGIVNPSGVGVYKGLIESEIVHFTAGTVTAGIRAWTLARGQEGTTAASHADGTILKLDATAGALGNAVQLDPTAQQSGTVNVSGAITSGGLLTGTGLTAPHASTHDVGGSDVLKDLTRLAAGPAIHGYIAWNGDIITATVGKNPAAGHLYLAKILTAHAYTVNAVDIYVGTGGTGATPLANCFLGIYDSGGTRRFASADQSSVWNSAGLKSVTVSGGYVVTANDFIYVALLIGTQATTACSVSSFAPFAQAQATANLTAATDRWGDNTTGQTSLPNPAITLANSVLTTNLFWAGVK